MPPTSATSLFFCSFYKQLKTKYSQYLPLSFFIPNSPLIPPNKAYNNSLYVSNCFNILFKINWLFLIFLSNMWSKCHFLHLRRHYSHVCRILQSSILLLSLAAFYNLLRFYLANAFSLLNFVFSEFIFAPMYQGSPQDHSQVQQGNDSHNSYSYYIHGYGFLWQTDTD